MRTTSGIILAAAVLAGALSLGSCASSMYDSGGGRTYLGFTLGIESAPPPPRLEFDREPRMDAIEDSDVQVVQSPDPGCDLFQFQGAFYLYSSGYWYRGDRYDGPYRVLDVRRVPRSVLSVPEQHWRHRPRWDRDDDRDRDGRDRDRGGDPDRR